MEHNFDIVIVGGGLVGASLACALGEQDLRIAVVEAVPFGADSQPSYDDRTVAMAYGSRRIFEGMGLWAAIEQHGVSAIEKIHVSDRGHIGKTRLDCADENLEALGYVVENRVLGAVLSARLQLLENVSLLCPASVTRIQCDAGSAQVDIEHEGVVTSLQASLLVAADGGKSFVREQMGIRSFGTDYGQTAVITNVSCQRPHRHVAYERFTDTGPLAVLPLTDLAGEHRCSIVWTVNEAQLDELLALDEAGFLARLQARFGDQLGRFSRAGKRVAYPLALRQAREHVRERLALIGNAAHTIHPIAGQGFNLGLRDVAVLAQVLVEAQQAGQDIGRLEVLKNYARWRRHDHLRVIGFTDSMVRVFSNNLTPLALARNIGLLAADLCPPLKHLITRQAMGLTGKLPRLGRGLKLR
ncbi:2-octaprenyl-6-methoxyphenyl hydroxylase [Sulfuriflexus sp.]|uniref:2-octaprenyl-6-methoxyphenyl hydroxylase n=1 Tax=Sulfuriflexus sp. TaxID=2015443 RepID=UPI0028CEA4BD|nr:2-octaprenyl-6-methoxyphenyl hydroxylase [Sulfuriflexus sp.]MDT8405577.1 2-octaprenyl-6-methoxyphenyl hydroxylase [Sulfuriflexus sp.]